MNSLIIHGPIWQFECEICHFMGDCWDSQSEAAGEMELHDCLQSVHGWAADEIKRLRAAGDALAVAYRTLGGLEVAYDPPLRSWEEARRG